jgi:hypothetical protein
MMRPVLYAAIILFTLTTTATALVYVEKQGVLFYFPENETEIAAALTEKMPEFISFLAQKGLAINRPLHIILDDKLDEPQVKVHVIPHREIRIPLRAPGVLEDGYTREDPWAYYLFKGLCLQGIYGIRSGIPGLLHKGFGDIVSPNVIIPPWVEDGICGLLYAQYRGKKIQDPFEAAVFHASPPPDLDIISHHPQIWPGYHGYRIYGKPFMHWLNREYGWSKILKFLQLHGRGIIPIEIDLKAIKVFGKTGAALWSDFQKAYTREIPAGEGLLITGYWGEPFVYWNRAGVYPGKVQVRQRGRYGYAEPDGTLWVSQYDELARLYKYSKGTVVSMDLKRVWDPGPGRVAVTRMGHRPYLIIFADDARGGFRRARRSDSDRALLIAAPGGVIQLSGPVRDGQGRIAVAANTAGNWDIWVYDDQWHRLTKTPSIEMDPWWEGDTLVYASNMSGKFQIHAANQNPLTQSAYGAILPRHGKYLNLTARGWKLQNYKLERVAFAKLAYPMDARVEAPAEHGPMETKPYTPFKSLWPNYIRPDLFAAVTDLQIGIATKSRDVTGDYIFDAGIRYSFDTNFLALRGALQVRRIGARYTRYPLSYTTALDQTVDEARNEVKLFWRPIEEKTISTEDLLRTADGFELREGLELSVNWRTWRPLEGEDSYQDEGWAALSFATRQGILGGWGNLEIFTESRQSLSLGLNLLFGDQIISVMDLMAGRAWGQPTLGHTTFRIGGNIGEGYFTRNPSRLFPVRGFDSNLLESSKAAAGRIEVLWPLANLQYGYTTVPLFLHRLRLGTFVDAGLASEKFKADDLLVGAGFEFVTSLEIAWGNLSAFRIGVAWPLVQPDFLNEKGPQFVFQLGKPL